MARMCSKSLYLQEMGVRQMKIGEVGELSRAQEKHFQVFIFINDPYFW